MMKVELLFRLSDCITAVLSIGGTSEIGSA